MLSILFNCHSSLLVSDGHTAIYTDPFFGRAFSTWRPYPEPYLSATEVVSELSTHQYAAIVISHAHDDHCDNEFIERNPNLTYIIPNYESRSLERKLRKCGVTSIVHMYDDIPHVFGTLKLNTYFYPEISREDATVTIGDNETLVVHANDCWWPMSSELAVRIQEFCGEVLFASQINTADSFPMAYDCYSDDEANEVRLARISKHVHAFERNLLIRNDMRGLVYAGHVLVDSPIHRVRQQTTPNFDTVLQLAHNPRGILPQVLKMSPGDRYCEGRVIRAEPIKIGARRICDSHTDESPYDTEPKLTSQIAPNVVVKMEQLRLDLVGYFDAFDSFVATQSKKTGFRPPMGRFQIRARSGETELYQSNDLANRCDLSLNLSVGTWKQLVSGELVFDDVYIGSLGWFSKYPRDLHNGDCIRWLSQFGYIWAGKLRRPKTTDSAIPNS
jgi:hypothetical protein